MSADVFPLEDLFDFIAIRIPAIALVKRRRCVAGILNVNFTLVSSTLICRDAEILARRPAAHCSRLMVALGWKVGE